jgi:hypothetical protein
MHNSTQYSFSGWKAIGKDPNSPLPSSPLFLNESGNYSYSTDFKIDSASPTIDGGAFVGLTVDFFGNSINNLPDIGVFEFRENVISPPKNLRIISKN